MDVPCGGDGGVGSIEFPVWGPGGGGGGGTVILLILGEEFALALDICDEADIYNSQPNLIKTY